MQEVRIPWRLTITYLTGKEAHYMYKAVYDGHISGNGQFTKLCQSFFENKWGFKKCLLTTSCTDALEMAALLINVELGDKKLIGNKYYNIIYANINKNVLIDDIPAYAAIIHQGGKLLLSGFYNEDYDDINQKAIESGLQLINRRGKNNWLLLNYLKVN